MGKRALVLLVALLLAGLAAFAVFQFLENYRAGEDEAREFSPVFRAAAAIAEGTNGEVALQTQLIIAGEENVADMPEGAITTEEELGAVLRGKLAAGPIDKNAIITRSQWVSVTVEVKPLATQIPSGKQAMTISTDAVRGINGFVEPGDRVNLIITVDIEFDQIPVDSPIFGVPSGQTPGGEGQTPAEEQQTETITYTRYVLQGLPVLAVGRDIRPEEGETPEVEVTPTTIAGEGGAQPEAPETIFTLEVSPEEAERLAYSFENGSVWLTLVPSDFVKVDTQGVTIETLFTGDIVEDIFG